MKYKKSIIIVTFITLLVMLPPIVYSPIMVNAQEQNQQIQPSTFGGRNLRCGWEDGIVNALASAFRYVGVYVWDAIVNGIGGILGDFLNQMGVGDILNSCLTGEDDLNGINGDIQLELPDNATGFPADMSTAVQINNWMWHLVISLIGIIMFAVFVGRILPGAREKMKGKIGIIMVALILTPATLYICKLVIEFNSALCTAFTEYFLSDYANPGSAVVSEIIGPGIAAGLITLIIPIIIILLLIVWLVILYFRHIIIVFSVALMPAMPILLCFDSTSGFAKKFITTFVEWTFLLFFYDVILVFAIDSASIGTFGSTFGAIGFLAFMCIMPKMYFQSTAAVSKAVSGAVRTGAMMAASGGGAAVGGFAGASAALKGGKLAARGIARGVRGAKDAASRMSKGLQAGKAVKTGKAVPTQGRFANDARAFANATPKQRKIAGKGESKATRQRLWRDDKENRQIQRDHRDGISSHKNKAEKDAAVKEQKQLGSNIKRTQGKNDRHGLTKDDNERWMDLKNKPRNKEEQQEFNDLNKKRDQYDTGGGRSKDMERIHDLKQQERSIPQKEKDYNNYIEQRGVGWDNKLKYGLMKSDMKEKIAQAKNEWKVGMKGGPLPSGLNKGERTKAKGLDVDIKGHKESIKKLRGQSSQRGKPGRKQDKTKKEIGGQNFLKGRREKDKKQVLKGPEKRLEEEYKGKKREMKKQQPGLTQRVKSAYGIGKERRGLVKKYAPKTKKTGGIGKLIGGMAKIPLAVIG